jgi:hypothetical protein
MDFKAEPQMFKSSNGKRYLTEDEARSASMLHEVKTMMLKVFDYRYDRDAETHAKMILELEDKGVLVLDWDKIEELTK